MDTATFWTQVAAYNEKTWAVQAVMIAAAAYLTYRVLAKPGPKTDVWMKAFLAFCFAWNGIVFFLVFLRNPISMLTGVPLFIIVSVLFVVDIFAKKTHFKLPESGWMRGLTIAWIALATLYPLLGWPLGHTWARILLPLFPCPLTVFAIALVAASVPNADKKGFIALLPWALLGLPKCFGALDCYEDCVLFASGIYGMIVLIKHWAAINYKTSRRQK
ncbi:MAG: hypothetical protein JW934_14185 [Anaerolineae bacterium]|nr:hypothetical protein [Anaerolineae bacterium]